MPGIIALVLGHLLVRAQKHGALEGCAAELGGVISPRGPRGVGSPCGPRVSPHTNARSTQRGRPQRLGGLTRNEGSGSFWYTELVMKPVTLFSAYRIGSGSADDLPMPE